MVVQHQELHGVPGDLGGAHQEGPGLREWHLRFLDILEKVFGISECPDLQRLDPGVCHRHLLGIGNDGCASYLFELHWRHPASGVPEGHTTGLDSGGPQLPLEVVFREVEIVV